MTPQQYENKLSYFMIYVLPNIDITSISMELGNYHFGKHMLEVILIDCDNKEVTCRDRLLGRFTVILDV